MPFPWQAWVLRQWQTRSWASALLWPVSGLTWLVVMWRRRQRRIHPPLGLGVPVVAVGNVIAGGAGKTPLVMALAMHWKSQGIKLGVVARGYGRHAKQVTAVHEHSAFGDVGDEPLLVWRRCQVPVFVGADRAACCRALLAAHPDTQVLISDDGLQHAGLHRDIELCVFDERGFGNGWLLPAGPLREPWPRPADPSVQTWNLGSHPFPNLDLVMLQRQLAPYAVQANGQRRPLNDWKGQRVHALAAIAKPQLFFDGLRQQGLDLGLAQAWPDHDPLIEFKPEVAEGDWFCTEKDAVKLWRRHPHVWAVPLLLEGLAPWLTQIDQALALRISSRHGTQIA
jgi:tetraacyldisaccharide 4'-kinase